jgi:hypothetical protein
VTARASAAPGRGGEGAESIYGAAFSGKHAYLLDWYFGKGSLLMFPRAIDLESHGAVPIEFGQDPVYEPPDGELAARFGAVDRALYRCTDLARVSLALAYGDEGGYWVSRALATEDDRAWAVAALTAPAREASLAPHDVDFWRSAFPAYGGAPPGGNRARAWVRAFVPRAQRSAKARALGINVRRAAEGLLVDAQGQFAGRYDARFDELEAVRRSSRQRDPRFAATLDRSPGQ